MLLWDIRGKRVSQSSSKGISQRSVFKRRGFSHKRSSFTLHVSSLLAKVVEAYTLPTANIHTVLPCDVKSKRIALCKLGNSSWHFATASRQIWCKQFWKIPVAASCNYPIVPKSRNEFMTAHSSCTSSDWKVLANKRSDGKIRGPSNVCIAKCNRCGWEKAACGSYSWRSAHATSTLVTMHGYWNPQ